jgi:hypothetical protein
MTLKSALLASLAVLAVLSCSNDNGDKNPVDPATPFPYATPSLSTVQPDLGDLQQQQRAFAAKGLCHALSAVAVSWVNLNVAVRLAVPIAAFGACLNAHPVYLGESTWRWTANGGAGSPAWTAELTAHDAGSGNVDWSMRISGTLLALDRFLWFDGQCDTAAQSGIWHYYDPANRPASEEAVRCTWSLPSSPSAPRSIVFENMTAGQPDSGDRLRYELADSIASIGFDDASPPGTTRIRWDLRDGAGMTVTASGDSCCWGDRPLFPDIVCQP